MIGGTHSGLWVGLACLALAAARPTAAQVPAPEEESVADLDIEELGRLRVTSASRRPEPASRVSAAVFVITRDEIRRSGASSLPEALRLAPGLQVARVTARDWSITSRGFAEQSPNKLLVLIDGRAVYSPLFAGVFWDVQDVVLEDVDRIEVILGSGATLWGSNAVNGVINRHYPSGHQDQEPPRRPPGQLHTAPDRREPAGRRAALQRSQGDTRLRRDRQAP